MLIYNNNISLSILQTGVILQYIQTSNLWLGQLVPIKYLQVVLVDEVRLLLLLGLPGLVELLNVLDELEGGVEVAARRRELSGLLSTTVRCNFFLPK